MFANILYGIFSITFLLFGTFGLFFWYCFEEEHDPGLSPSDPQVFKPRTMKLLYNSSMVGWIICWLSMLILVLNDLKMPWQIFVLNCLLLFFSAASFLILLKKNKSANHAFTHIQPLLLFFINLPTFGGLAIIQQRYLFHV